MEVGKGITKELREWWVRKFPIMDKELNKDFNAIADRIDEAHESKISRAAQLLADAEKDRDFNYANWQDCKQKVLQHNITIDELDAEIERLKDELAHCIELPKDANGEPIHMGDVMDSDHYEDGTVVGLQFFSGEFLNTANKTLRVLIAIRPHGWDTPTWHDPESYHQPDTWERIIADALGCEPSDVSSDSDLAELVGRCRRLAGDVE